MDEFLADEVEDIMCDQVIITTELDVFENNANKVAITKVRLAVTLFTKSFLPAVVGIYYAYLRNQKMVVENLKRHVFPTIVAFLANSISRSLSSVQRGITYPLTIAYKPIENQDSTIEDDTPEKSVEVLVLSKPETITADVIFIHGLHGSLVNTWRQGDWRHPNHHLRKKTVERRMSTGEIKDRVRRISLKRSSSDVYTTCPKKMLKITGEQVHAENTDDNEVLEEDGRKEYSNCWPRDWIPMDCPGARVIAVNYTTDPHLWRPIWIKKRNRTSMTERSKEMIKHLLDLGVGKHPIVWVGHSKGGLFIKQILIDSWENKENCPKLANIYRETKSILFYSVPHRGSYLADVTLPLLKRSVELTEIQRNCSFVLNLHDRFLEVLKESGAAPEIFSFIETSFTLMSIVYLKIVAFESADPGIGYICGVPLDHREICKPAARDCLLYRELVRLIRTSQTVVS